eukprot:gene6216-9225_t
MDEQTCNLTEHPQYEEIKHKYKSLQRGRIGAGRRKTKKLTVGHEIPTSEPCALRFDSKVHLFAVSVIESLLGTPRSLSDNPNSRGKASVPQRFVAKLTCGDKQHVEDVQKWVQLQTRPWGNIGSTHPLHQSGDYDFTTIGLAFAVHVFSDDILSKELKDIICQKLLLRERTGRPKICVPKAIFSVLETENHLLMMNGSLYLAHIHKLLSEGEAVGITLEEVFLFIYLQEMIESGKTCLWEFNSLPYLGYTVIGLLALYECKVFRLQKLTRQALDYICFTFALGSLQYRRWAPYRRRIDYSRKPSLSINAMTAFMQVWGERLGLPIRIAHLPPD